MEIGNKYNIGDEVYVLEIGKFIRGKVHHIEVDIIKDKIKCYYFLEGATELGNDYIQNPYEEDELSSTLEELIKKIGVI